MENPRLAIMKVMKRISLENVRDNKKRNDRDLTSKTGLCSSAIILESAIETSVALSVIWMRNARGTIPLALKRKLRRREW